MFPNSAPRHRGVMLTVSAVPAGFLAFLERRGLAAQASRTDEGVYLQPRVPLREIIAAFDRVGVRVHGFAPASGPTWHDSARPVSGARRVWRTRAVRSGCRHSLDSSLALCFIAR